MVETTGPGHDAAAKVAESLRPAEEVKKAGEEEMRIAKNELDMIRNNPEFARLYDENAQTGAENLGNDLPALKVHSVGKSSTNELSDGTEPEDGYFFYVPKQLQFKDVTAHICTISRGYYAEGMVDPKGVKQPPKWNQIIGGIIQNDDLMYPFLRFITGKNLQPMWDFGKSASKYTRAKPFGIPMFALSVRMWNKKEKNPYGNSWVTYYDIVKHENGEPKLVTDPALFHFLKNAVGELEDQINRLIEAKAMETEKQPERIESEPAPIAAEDREVVDSQDIPF